MAPLAPESSRRHWRDILAAMTAPGRRGRPDFVLIIAGIDLSAPSILAMASVMGAAAITVRRRAAR
jgi:predicted ABC-type sugar transport system permease subunit